MPTFVSNLHLKGRAGLSVGMEPFASEDTERGEWLPRPPLGEGERERVLYLRATCRGVEGTELEWCETIEGRWLRVGKGGSVCGGGAAAAAAAAASWWLVAMLDALEDVTVGALLGTLHFVSLCPSVVSVCACAVLTGGFLERVRPESRWGGGLSEWGDTITAGKGVWETDWWTSSMRASCRKGCSSR